MRAMGVVFADFAETFLGGPSQLGTPVGSRTVLGATLARLMQVEGLDGRCLFVRKRDEAPAAAALQATGLARRVELVAKDEAPRPRRSLIRSARKWSLNAWRGSLLGTTWFDEFVDPLAAALAIDHFGCDWLLCLDGHQPALDPAIATGMLAHAREHQAHARLVFTQAPPGLAGLVLSREGARDMLEKDTPVGLTISYRPESPATDPITRKPCYRIDPEVAQTAARLTGDTRRSREVLNAAFAALGDHCGASALCGWLRAQPRLLAGPLPLEVELELTTRTPVPESRLRPPAAAERRLATLAPVERLAAELAQYDDRLIMLAGHGDPLQHADFGAVCRQIRAAGVCGLGVETPLVDLSDEQLETLIAARVDVVEVRLDADSAATYRAVHGADAFERVLSNIERLSAARRAAASPQPLILPSITRCAVNQAEIDTFFDRWIRATGGAVVRGFNTYSGALRADELLATHPPIRRPCRRLDTRMLLLADGRTPWCAQDFNGETSRSSWFSTRLAELFESDALVQLRRRHAGGGWDAIPLCRPCTEWNRP